MLSHKRQQNRKERKMPKYGGIHYPNDVKGVTSGYPTHVPNGDGNAYGASTKKNIPDIGRRVRKGILNQRDPSSWKIPNK